MLRAQFNIIMKSVTRQTIVVDLPQGHAKLRRDLAISRGTRRTSGVAWCVDKDAWERERYEIAHCSSRLSIVLT